LPAQESSFDLVEKLTEMGVSATDVKKLKEAGFYTVQALHMRPRKVRRARPAARHRRPFTATVFRAASIGHSADPRAAPRRATRAVRRAGAHGTAARAADAPRRRARG
jgi:hypothetical protein